MFRICLALIFLIKLRTYIRQLKLISNSVQYQMIIAADSTPMNFKKIVLGKFLSPHILHDKAALNCIDLYVSISVL